MIKLAICDDDAFFLKKAKKLVFEFIQTHTEVVQIEIFEFVNPHMLYDDITDGDSYDIFLLDIEMPKLNGITLAQQIKELLPKAVVILLTSHAEFSYAQAGYTAQALRYVTKMNMDETLPEALNAAIKAVPYTYESYLTITHYRDSTRILYSDIIYVERVGRQLEIHVSSKHQTIYKESCGLNDLLRKISDSRFILIGRSCFINIDYVLSITNSEIVMKNGEKLPVSKKMLPGLKDLFFRLWGNIS